MFILDENRAPKIEDLNLPEQFKEDFDEDELRKI